MGQRKDIDGSASVPTFYGKELRWKREAAGLTLQQLVEGSFYGPSHLSEIERGARRMPAELAEHVDKALGTDGFFKRRCEDVRKAKRRGHASYFERVLEAEKHAKSIEEWCPTLIPGLLQTAAYARALVRAAMPLAPDDEVEEKVSARLARARLFEDNQRTPMYWAILSESLLRQPVLPPEQAAEQLESIAALARRRRIVPQILPWNCGPHPLMMGMAKIMAFPDAPPLVYLESQHSGDTIDDPALVDEYRRSYDLLRAAALPPEASLALIEKAAEDDRNGKQRD
ncbi:MULTISPECIES: helix-turn-helix transcriptional regulator [unclassified Streptomyces]|uniref:helix-turn-helix domain-containing protein n=1 Tax=unclassified Streptomyces TaxID=2593676 RepID=UPI002DD82894|nr:helix-turn-helix transcriptional regulator [Streptomyces sp. NBC_01750]WSB00739.1 helix-turn-helix transcriptional regulator [Streptomyces sp. NBC_01794]WSD34904.1 helix-turn-helix transcriptional regulator [Streptomyces sp. NBC_01750]